MSAVSCQAPSWVPDVPACSVHVRRFKKNEEQMFTPQRSYYDQEKIKTVSGLLLLPQRATRDGSKMVLLKA